MHIFEYVLFYTGIQGSTVLNIFNYKFLQIIMIVLI